MHRLRGTAPRAPPAGPTTPSTPGCSTNCATRRRAIGSTNTIVGNATAHDSSHALYHSPCQPAFRPTTVSVEIPDTMIVINMLSMNGMEIALCRGGNFCIGNLLGNDP